MFSVGNCVVLEYDLCIILEFSIIVRWNEMWVIFVEGGKLKYFEKIFGARLKLINFIVYLSLGFDFGIVEVERYEFYYMVIFFFLCKFYIVFIYGINLI